MKGLTDNRPQPILRQREVKYTGNEPLGLLNHLTNHRLAISLTEQADRGEISEAAWREALKPLLVNIRNRSTAHPEWGVEISDAGGTQI